MEVKHRIMEYLTENIKDKDLNNLIIRAWESRNKVFGGGVQLYKPFGTISVSTTGNECELNCAHCEKHYLGSMVSIDYALQQVNKKKAHSLLISGGCDKKGRVKFQQCIEKIKELKKDYKINMHVGMLKDADIKNIIKLADVISLDIPVSDRVVKEVYRLGFSAEDYIELYKRLKEEIRVVPHICIGLDGNGVKAELSVLQALAELNPARICFIIFIPTPGTSFQNRQPPEVNEVLKVLASARIKMPNTRIALGCMRPGGRYRKTLDALALLTGINGIVMPSKPAVEMVSELGMETEWINNCCAF